MHTVCLCIQGGTNLRTAHAYNQASTCLRPHTPGLQKGSLMGTRGSAQARRSLTCAEDPLSAIQHLH